MFAYSGQELKTSRTTNPLNIGDGGEGMAVSLILRVGTEGSD